MDKRWSLVRALKEVGERAETDNARSAAQRRKQRLLDNVVQPSRNWYVQSELDLSGLGHHLARLAVHESLTKGGRSDATLPLAVRYSVLSQQLLLARQDDEFARLGLSHGHIDTPTQLIAAGFSLGWTKAIARFAIWVLNGALRGYYSDTAPIYRNCFPWFCLQLFSDWYGLQEERWPDHPFAAAEYEELLGAWRSPDATHLRSILNAVCDRHTAECFKWSDKPDKHGDFVDDVYWAWPIEVHMVFRLREDLGLPIPEIDHPLMKTPLGIYLPPAPMVSDELLDKITAMAIDQYPELASKI